MNKCITVLELGGHSSRCPHDADAPVRLEMTEDARLVGLLELCGSCRRALLARFSRGTP